ncbi:MAG: pyrE [Rickettsiaceae bacterium]|jgi:orotate phosphoribosyltransferase|nr:pyrE [Rickettsiaceae bacterium]
MDILQEFKDAEAILSGHFVLSSGLHSDTYLQCARVLMDPKRSERLCSALAKKVKEKLGENAVDIIVAPAMGGVVVGYEMGRQLGVNTIFCERVEGKFEIRRGFSMEPGARVLVIEDVVTTGKSSLETMDCIKEHGGRIVAEASLIDRSNGKTDLGVPLISLLALDVKTYSEDNLPPALQNTPAVKPGSRWLNKKVS